MSSKAGQEDRLDSTKASLARIQRQLNSSGRVFLQGPLLKRSELLRKWNKRWFSLDPTSGRLEYRIEKGDIAPKGSIIFDAGSSIIVSPLNLQGSVNYDGCCIYIQTSTKKEYFLCAETPKAALAWVSTIRASVVVLKAHKEAVCSLGGSGSSNIGTVAAAVAAANLTAKQAAKEVAQSSTSNNLGATEGSLDNLSIMKETLKVKDDELHQIAEDIRSRDAAIKDLAQRLSATAEAGEAAASAAHIMEKEVHSMRSEIAQLRKELDVKLQCSSEELRALGRKLSTTERARDDALKEALLWQSQLTKAREHAAFMQAALDKAEETRRNLSLGPGLQDHTGGTVSEVHLPSQGNEANSETPLETINDSLRTMDNGFEELLCDLEGVEKAK